MLLDLLANANQSKHLESIIAISIIAIIVIIAIIAIIIEMAA